MKRHSTSLIIREMKTKKSIKRAPITKAKNTCWHGCGETGTGTLVHCWRECTTGLRCVQQYSGLYCKISIIIFVKSKIGRPPLGAWPEEPKAQSPRDTCTPMSLAAKAWKSPKCPSAGKPTVVHT